MVCISVTNWTLKGVIFKVVIFSVQVYWLKVFCINTLTTFIKIQNLNDISQSLWLEKWNSIQYCKVDQVSQYLRSKYLTCASLSMFMVLNRIECKLVFKVTKLRKWLHNFTRIKVDRCLSVFAFWSLITEM